jgi:hypothetical protein
MGQSILCTLITYGGKPINKTAGTIVSSKLKKKQIKKSSLKSKCSVCKSNYLNSYKEHYSSDLHKANRIKSMFSVISR